MPDRPDIDAIKARQATSAFAYGHITSCRQIAGDGWFSLELTFDVTAPNDDGPGLLHKWFADHELLGAQIAPFDRIDAQDNPSRAGIPELLAWIEHLESGLRAQCGDVIKAAEGDPGIAYFRERAEQILGELNANPHRDDGKG